MGVALVTGCSSGFGLAASIELARRGDVVVASMRNLAKAGPLRDAAAAAGVDVDLVALDVVDDVSVQGAVGDVLERHGRIDAVVNNAGIGWFAPVEETSDADLQLVLEANTFGPLRVCRAALPAMREQGAGVVVNVSSVSGRMAAPFYGPYAASKHALEALSEALSVEAAPFGIRVCCVEPGFFRTAIMDNAAEAAVRSDGPYAGAAGVVRSANQRAMEQAPPPDEVARAIADAVHDPATPLRVPVGRDAEAMIAFKASVSDREWAEATRRYLGLA